MFDFTKFENELFPKWIEQFRSGNGIGEYSFTKRGPTSFYGTTDVLISLYNTGKLDLTEEEKDQWAKVINQFQDPKTGWYKRTFTMHYKEHTTAYAIAALYLIDRKPAYPLNWKDKILKSKRAMEKWIKRPNWSFIWATSHIISGIPASLLMTGEGTQEFYDWYFDWLDNQADSNSGFYLRGLIHKLKLVRLPRKQEMAGAFHMYYVYEFVKRMWPYPEKIVDHTLRLQHENGLWEKDITFCVDLDGLYCLTRSSRNANGYRKKDVELAVRKYLVTAEKIFNNEEFFYKSYQNSHRLTGALNAIAECQKFYPNLVKTTNKWRQSLDKACFI
ncbi:MAG: hypothetical protein GTO17_03245 [Candidatus Aminicenantes bacterium]|nr:hypothetical protein [Candidatus Aminicenantes bacterium]